MKKTLLGVVALLLAAGSGLADSSPSAKSATQPALNPPAAGTLKSVKENEIVITDAFGKDWDFQLKDASKVQLQQVNDKGTAESNVSNNFQAAKPSDLKVGMRCNVIWQPTGGGMSAVLIRAEPAEVPVKRIQR